MKLAIVGSTALGGPRSRAIILETITRLKPTAIISGGADGIDSLAAEIGRELGLEVDERKPEVRRWEDQPGVTHGRSCVRKGFKTRNQEIADACDALLRIAWNPEDQRKVTGKKPTYGSGWTRDRAQEQGKPCDEHVLTLEEDKAP